MRLRCWFKKLPAMLPRLWCGGQDEVRGEHFGTIQQLIPRHLWAVLLAGGDGVRLRGLTESIVGDQRPKQFCVPDPR